MFLEIISPNKKAFEDEIIGVKVPGNLGSFEVLNNHAPIISILEKGTIRIRMASNSQKLFQIDSGVIQVKNNKIVILAESIH